MAPPVFKTGLAANIVAGGFDSLPPPPLFPSNLLEFLNDCHASANRRASHSRQPCSARRSARSPRRLRSGCKSCRSTLRAGARHFAEFRRARSCAPRCVAGRETSGSAIQRATGSGPLLAQESSQAAIAVGSERRRASSPIDSPATVQRLGEAKHPRRYHGVGSKPLCDRASSLDDLGDLRIVGERQHARRAALGRTRTEFHDARALIDVAPLEREHFHLARAGQKR